MSLTEPLLIQKLNSKLGYLTERQKALAQNLANIDTPNYRAKDLEKVDFNKAITMQSGRLDMRTSSAKHLGGTLRDNSIFSTIKDRAADDRKPLGNNVFLEEQMGKVSDTGAEHQFTTTLMKKFHQLYRSAISSNGSV
jgi:flagellar basal-body rod protein FlgB